MLSLSIQLLLGREECPSLLMVMRMYQIYKEHVETFLRGNWDSK